jgi:hypothetical protein
LDSSVGPTKSFPCEIKGPLFPVYPPNSFLFSNPTLLLHSYLAPTILFVLNA